MRGKNANNSWLLNNQHNPSQRLFFRHLEQFDSRRSVFQCNPLFCKFIPASFYHVCLIVLQTISYFYVMKVFYGHFLLKNHMYACIEWRQRNVAWCIILLQPKYPLICNNVCVNIVRTIIYTVICRWKAKTL